jgi:tripeptidyl-peptidase I
MRNDHLHEVVFVIHQKNIVELTEFLHDVSNPLSENYGQHLLQEEIVRLTRNQEARDAVVSYLHANGASVVSETLSSEYITARAPIAIWEELFNCKFYLYHQTDENRVVNTLVRTESYSIPAILGHHVDSVFNTVQMPYRQSTMAEREVIQNTGKLNLEASGKYISPSLLKSYYDLGSGTSCNASTQCIYASYDHTFSPSDLSKFQTTYGTKKQSVKSVIGTPTSLSVCNATPELCIEANLHVQYLLAVSPDSPTTFWYSDLDGFSSWLVEVASSKDPPLVININYFVEEPYVSGSELDAFNIQAIKLGAMGVTIVVPSGDDGAISRLVRTNGTSKCSYSPTFPASSPYVVAVGATSVSTYKHAL